MTDANASAGLLGQLRQSLGSILELAQVRLSLLGTELELEKHRLLLGVFWGALALLSLTVATVLLCGFVLLLLWEGYRLAALASLIAIFFALGLLLLQAARRRLVAQSNIFSTSLAELASDRQTLSPTPPHENG